MILTKHPIGRISNSQTYGTGQIFQYRVSGLPIGEHAFVAEFPHEGWRILRWNDEWHGNWTGNYESAEAALESLREELLTVA